MDALSNHHETPLVSIVLAAHNGDAHLVPRAVKSLMAQDLDHKDMELIITFDGLPDKKAEKFLKQITADFPIMLVCTEKKIGYYCVSRNQAFPAVHGLYIANLDADNEYKSNHLSGLIRDIRTPNAEGLVPHFVYSRREYVKDSKKVQEKLPTGPSTLVEWLPVNLANLVTSPQGNFIDTGDLLISKGAFYELAERSGFPWDPNMRRFGDWDLVCRLAKHGFKGRAVDQITSIYHWTGKNLQTERWLSPDVMIIPESIYNTLRDKGLIIDPKKK